MANRKNLDEKIAATKAESEQIQNRLKELLQQQKAEERKARNHRLCQRGGQIEKLLPGLIKLTDEQFNIFVQKTLLSGYAAKVLKELLPTESGNGQNSGGTAQAAKEPEAAKRVG